MATTKKKSTAKKASRKSYFADLSIAAHASVFTVCGSNSQRTDRVSQVSRTAAQRSF